MTTPNPAITSLEATILDRNSEYLGVSTLQLMENAGRSVADEIVARFGAGSSVVIYGGTGRNGGDGMVIARHLAGRGLRISFKLVGSEESISDPAVLQNWRALKSMSTTVKIDQYRDSSSLSESDSDVVVDALLGTGVRGKLRQPVLKAVEVINESRGYKIAVDVPTGIESDTGEVLGDAVRANLTVTLHAIKKGFSTAKEFCGEIKAADIGIPPEAAVFAGPGDVDVAVVRRSPEAHKGQFGRLLVIGGSEIFTGAPALVGLAAYRTGTDLVFVAAPERTAQAISSISPNLITIKLPGANLKPTHVRILREQLEKANAIAIGPGLGLDKQTISAARKIIQLVQQLKKPLLLDADGLKALGVVKKKVFDNSTVMTPHAGEFQAVFGKPPSRDLKVRSSEVRAFATRSGAVVLLKGHTDVISDGVSVKLNDTGNPGMTVGGTGDVLSGIVAGLMAQGVGGFRAAVAGAFVNGAAGDLAEEEYGYHLTPTDLLDHIPKVLDDPMCHKAIRERRLL
ncbi:MAG: NAD(P)H-hydrate dehydratase [Candidatus Bathyarchaeia archaeon]